MGQKGRRLWWWGHMVTPHELAGPIKMVPKEGLLDFFLPTTCLITTTGEKAKKMMCQMLHPSSHALPNPLVNSHHSHPLVAFFRNEAYNSNSLIFFRFWVDSLSFILDVCRISEKETSDTSSLIDVNQFSDQSLYHQRFQIARPSITLEIGWSNVNSLTTIKMFWSLCRSSAIFTHKSNEEMINLSIRLWHQVWESTL